MLDTGSNRVPTRRGLAAIVCGLACSAWFGCASPALPKKACLSLSTSDTLNLYDGQPHELTVFVYPLSDPAGFEQANVDDLLGGAAPKGVLAPPVPITLQPADVKRSFQELFPAATLFLGIVADYDRTPDGPNGLRSVVVQARCGMRKPKITLASSEIILQE